MKKIIKKFIFSFSVFGLFLINTSMVSAYYYNQNNNIPVCDSTYKLRCPFDVYCRNINGMMAYACPAAYPNQPLENIYMYDSYNNQHNHVNNNYIYENSNSYYFTNSYYTNPVQRPFYDLTPTQNQANDKYVYYYTY